MDKPNDFDKVQAYGDYTPLPAGAYYCKIMSVEETKSKAGKDMLKISLDIAEGEHKDYYTNAYKADTRDNKQWGCIVNQVLKNDDGSTSRGFKTFITSVEESNNFFVTWGNKFAACLKGKLIGGLFRREEYLKQDGKTAWSTKCFNFRGIESIAKGLPAPEDKPLAQTATGPYSFKEAMATIPTLTDDDLPF